MQIERTRSSTNNFIWGVVFKIVGIVSQFVIRIILIRVLGGEYLGLNSLFTSVLSVLSLAELGVGSALVFNMYRAIADDDHDRICALLRFYRTCYTVIGCAILGVGLALMPAIPYLVGKDLPEGLNIYVLYAINLAGTASTYFLFAYKNSLLQAFQRVDITHKIMSVAGLIQFGLQCALLFIFKNYYLYAIVVPAVNIANNIATAIIASKKFPQYKPSGILPKEDKRMIFVKVKSLVTYKIGNVVSNSVDNIVISVFLGLTMLGIYGNYYYVISAIFSIFTIFYNAMAAGIGNSIALDDNKKNYGDFNKLLLLQACLCGFCMTALMCLFQDFIGMCFGEENLFALSVVICLVIYFYVWKIQDIVYVYKDAAGMWEKDRWRPLVSAAINLGLNLALVNFIGIYGIILSTVFCCVFIDLPWGAAVLFKSYFKVKLRYYFLRLAVYTVVNVAVCAATYGLTMLIPSSDVLWIKILWFILKMIMCVVIPVGTFVAVYWRTGEFKALIAKFKGLIKRRRRDEDNQ